MIAIATLKAAGLSAEQVVAVLEAAEAEQAGRDEAKRAANRERMVRRRDLCPDVPEELRRLVLERDDFSCVYCRKEEDLSIDHIVAVSRGGTNDIDNLCVACKPCNSKKKDRDRKAFVRSLSKDVRGQVRPSADIAGQPPSQVSPSFSPSTPTPITTPSSPSPSSLRSEVTGSGEPVAPSKLKYPPAFEGWWLAYPRTPIMSKKEAAAAWNRLSPEDRLRAVTAVAPYRKFLASKPEHPVLHACRFLSQRRFEGFDGSTGPPAAAGYQPPPGAVSFIDKMKEKSNGHANGTGIRENTGLGEIRPDQPPELFVPR